MSAREYVYQCVYVIRGRLAPCLAQGIHTAHTHIHILTSIRSVFLSQLFGKHIHTQNMGIIEHFRTDNTEFEMCINTHALYVNR